MTMQRNIAGQVELLFAASRKKMDGTLKSEIAVRS